MYYYTDYEMLNTILGMGAAVMLVALALTIFMIIAEWKVYTKLDRPGWAVLIPFYNNYVLFDAVWSKSAFWTFFGFIAGGLVLSYVSMFLVDSLAILALIFSLAGWVLTILSLVWSIRCTNRLSKAFGHGAGFTIGLLFLPYIFWAILGFSKKERAVTQY